MNKVGFAFLLLFFAQVTSAQINPQVNYRNREPAKVIIMFSGSVITGALSHAMRDNGNKMLSHSFQALSIGFMLPAPYLLNIKPGTFWWYFASYSCIRFGLFDLVYNSARGLPLGYIGSTSVYDNTIRKFDPPSWLLFQGRGLVLSVGIKIPIDHL